MSPNTLRTTPCSKVQVLEGLHYHDFGAGASRPASGLRILSRFDLSADGRYIFFANIDKHNSDLMLVENSR